MSKPEKPRPITWQTRFLSWVIITAVRLVAATVRLCIDNEEETEALMERGGGMLVTWHGRTFLPVNRWRGKKRLRFHMLVSLSRDGDLQTEVFHQMGYRVIRGSTGRRGAAATREVLTMLAGGGVLSFTPDGPRGPAGIAQPGVVYFAQRSGKPIVPAGIAAWPRWETDSWDRFMIPRPFAKARWIYGDPIYVAPDEDLEAAAARVTDAINALQRRADAEVGAPPAPYAALPASPPPSSVSVR